MDDKHKRKMWEQLEPLFTSYDIVFDDFIRKLDSLGVPFPSEYEEDWIESLRSALKDTCDELNKLVWLIESILKYDCSASSLIEP